LHQFGDVFELNVKLRCQKVKKTNKTLVFHCFNYSVHNSAASCWDRAM